MYISVHVYEQNNINDAVLNFKNTDLTLLNFPSEKQ